MTAQVRGRRLGLTGGMGCGKSTVAGMFRELGFGVLESDGLVRELWEQDEEVKAEAVKRWGEGVMENSKFKIQNSKLEGGGAKLQTGKEAAGWGGVKIDRRRVAEIVFGDAGELEWAEGLLHPRVRVRWEGALAREPARDWVVEIPLLFEKSLASHFDLTLCVWASPATQAQRLAARGLSPTEMAARQGRQWPVKAKAERADLVVSNDGSRQFLRRQVEWTANRLPRPLL
ncbi:MAG: dephospho-CoA kinase [Opitutales bacterium]